MDIGLKDYEFVPAPLGTRRLRQLVYLNGELIGVISDMKAEYSYSLKHQHRVGKYYAASNVEQTKRHKTGAVIYKDIKGSISNSLEEAFVKLVMYHWQNRGL